MLEHASVWTHLTALGALLVVVRLVCFVNLMRAEHVPARVISACVLFAAGAVAVCLSPFYGAEFQWHTALTMWGAASYVWIDRRRPVGLPGARQ